MSTVGHPSRRPGTSHEEPGLPPLGLPRRVPSSRFLPENAPFRPINPRRSRARRRLSASSDGWTNGRGVQDALHRQTDQARTTGPARGAEWNGEASSCPRGSARQHPAQLLVARPPGKKRASAAAGAQRASSAPNTLARARATMRRSRSLLRISTRVPGIASRQTAASVYASAPAGAAGAPGADAATLCQLRQTAIASASHCSGWRQSWEKSIVTRTRNASSSRRSAASRRAYAASSSVSRRAVQAPDPAFHLPALVLEQVEAAKRSHRVAERTEVVGFVGRIDPHEHRLELLCALVHPPRKIGRRASRSSGLPTWTPGLSCRHLRRLGRRLLQGEIRE